MSKRTDQIAGLLREAVQKVIARGLQDPRVRGLVTITKVTVAPDLSKASLFVSVLPQERAELTMHGLKSSAKHIRRKVGETTAINRVPELVFEFDRGSRNQAEVIQALAAAAEHDNNPADPADDDQEQEQQDAPDQTLTDEPT